jgi:hypothetical protein
MKKITSLWILTLFLLSILSVGVSAICTPFPVFGKVDYFGEQVAGIEVEITAIDVRGNVQKVFTTTTNELGEYSEDLANQLEDCWYRTATLKIKGCEAQEGCIKEIDITDKSVVRVDFIFKEGEPKVITEENKVVVYKEKPIYICPDGSEKLDKSLCPKVEPEVVKVDDTAKDPVSYLLGAIIGLLATILGLFSWGKGFSGILNYWAKKDPQRAYKMAKTIIKNYKEGKYK